MRTRRTLHFPAWQWSVFRRHNGKVDTSCGRTVKGNQADAPSHTNGRIPEEAYILNWKSLCTVFNARSWSPSVILFVMGTEPLHVNRSLRSPREVNTLNQVRVIIRNPYRRTHASVNFHLRGQKLLESVVPNVQRSHDKFETVGIQLKTESMHKSPASNQLGHAI